MSIGTISELWRYPVKSMKGESLEQLEVVKDGVIGDRAFSIRSHLSRPRFPYFTGRDYAPLVLYRPRFSGQDEQPSPPTLDRLQVVTPEGRTLSATDPALFSEMEANARGDHRLEWVIADGPQTDAYPISVISRQTVGALAEALSSDAPVSNTAVSIHI